MVSGYQESSPLKTGSGYCRWGRHEAKYRLCEGKKSPAELCLGGWEPNTGERRFPRGSGPSSMTQSTDVESHK